jgi:hypothetical protein
MLTKRRRGPANTIHRAIRLVGQAAREHRALVNASKRIPKPVTWDWAAPRLVPLLSGPSLDPVDEPLVRARSPLGPMVQFSLDLGNVFVHVDQPVADRWECSSRQLMDRAMVNLRERSRRLTPERIGRGVLSGRDVKILDGSPRWASSLLLAGDELMRLFGDHDQILAAPAHGCLLSLPIDTPPRVVADIVVDFEIGQLHPLFLDPVVQEGGQLYWSDDGEVDDLD